MHGSKVVDLIGVNRRYQKKQHRRKNSWADGPNAIRSIDAHHKLEVAGVQIYAVIDAYSRKMI